MEGLRAALVLISQWPLFFVATVGVFAVALEASFPRRDSQIDGLRWLTSVTLTLFGTLLVQVAAPLMALLGGRAADAGDFGLLNMLGVPSLLAAAIGFLLFDAMSYAFHRVFHEVPALWRFHRTHHSASTVDASTAILHHPLEILLTAVASGAIAAILGIPPLAIVAHYTAATALAYWQHANIAALPAQRALGWLIVVPEFHEVHHSVAPQHHNTNYGLVFSFWDRAFGTLIDDPDLDGTIETGLDPNYWGHEETLVSLLVDPLRGPGHREDIEMTAPETAAPDAKKRGERMSDQQGDLI